MSTLARLLSGVSLTLFSLFGHAAPLWQNTASGMSIDQVIQLYPAASVPQHSLPVPDNVTESLQLDNLSIANHRWLASFYFREHKLLRVRLWLQPPQGVTSNGQAYEDIKAVLQHKYGAGVASDDATAAQQLGIAGLLDSRTHRWQAGDTLVALKLFGLGNAPGSVLIDYESRLDTEADKL